jgi:hypothetical protein
MQDRARQILGAVSQFQKAELVVAGARARRRAERRTVAVFEHRKGWGRVPLR